MKTVLIYSGGLDSTVLLYRLVQQQSDVACMHFGYGQRHYRKEFESAVRQCEKLSVKLVPVLLPAVSEYFRSGLLSGDIPEGHYTDKSMKATVVPFRNGIMLSIAAGYAVSIGAERLAIANHAGDHPIYPDCRREFITAMTSAIIQGTENAVMLISPFCEKTKADIVKMGRDYDVPMMETWSCYKGGDVHCGKCGTCVERKEAFQLAGVKDQIEYEG